MSTPKRFYWMKLKDSFMTSDTIDYFMSQKDGANYVVLYQMLCLKTINTAGRLSRQIGELIIPYDVEKIQRDCKWFSADTIRVALKLYQAVGLVYEDVDGTLVLSDHKNLVGSETSYAQQKRNQRELKKGDTPAQLPSATVDTPMDIVHPDIRDRDKRLDIRDKDIKKDSDLHGAGAPSRKETEIISVISLPLNDKSEYPITQADIDEWQSLYPAVDVMQALRSMRGWLISNPAKRKTKTGIKRFINAWLAREQDGYHPTNIPSNDSNGFQTSNPFMEMYEERRGNG